jgi:photosystem II stability/assembly factor-like uncharacterized protein
MLAQTKDDGTKKEVNQQVPIAVRRANEQDQIGLPKEQLVPGSATLAKHPLGYRVTENDKENFFESYQKNYVRLRAYPNKTIDPLLREKAYQHLLGMTSELKLHHLGPGLQSNIDKLLLSRRASKELLSGCTWVSVGPTNINGRVTNIAVDSNNGQRIFVTSVGGIWRSNDGGRRWQRVSEDFLSGVSGVFASVALNPGNSGEVYAGAGDPNYHKASDGNGIWFSPNGGDPGSWTKISETTLDGMVIYRIRIDPALPNDLYVATSGGVYLGTHSGGAFNFNQIAGFDAWTTDVAVDFSSVPRKIYAGVKAPSATFDRGIWRYDGTRWEKKDSGIPTQNSATLALALAASSPKTVYAKVENGLDGTLQGVYKTTTGGEPPALGSDAWATLANGMLMNDSLFNTGGYSWYNSILEVDPNDPDRVYGGGMDLFRSLNGGSDWEIISGGADPTYQQFVHADHHAVAFDPTNSKRLFVGDDGGVFKSTDTSIPTWHWIDISHGMVITQFYHVTGQHLTGSMIAGGSQDNGTEISFGNRTWYQPGGCDGSDVAIDAINGDTLYANCNGGLYELANPVPATAGGGSKINWNLPVQTEASAPLVTDPGRPRAALMAGQVMVGKEKRQILLKTTDAVNWLASSPLLASGDAITFISIAPSSDFQTYYVGIVNEDKSRATIWVTRDGGVKWMKNAVGIPNLDPAGAAIDKLNPDRAVAVFGGTGGVYVTTNGGANWSSVSGSGATALPNIWISGVVFDPSDRNSAFVSSGMGVYKGTITWGSKPSALWLPFRDGLTDGIDVNSIWVNTTTHNLMIGTMGHGAYERDINRNSSCSSTMLVVRDNVYDRGSTPSPYGVADAEHPIPDVPHPGFYKPNDTPQGKVYWWDSPDIRIDVPSLDPPANSIENADHVEVESCPVQVSPCPPGTVLDSSPEVDQAAKVYVQVANRGVHASSNVKVIALYTHATTRLPNLPIDFWTTTFPRASSSCGPLSAGDWHLVDEKQPCKTIPAVNAESPEVAQFNWSAPGRDAGPSCIITIVESEDDPIPESVRSTNELRPNKLIPRYRHMAARNMHIISAATPNSRINTVETLRIPNPTKLRLPIDLLISNPNANLGTTIQLMLPPETLRYLKIEKLHSVPLKLAPEQTAVASQLGKTTGFAMQLVGSEGAVRNLVLEPGQMVEVGLLLESGQTARPGTSSRVTVITASKNQIIGGNTFILRVPAEANSVSEPVKK